jgi:hypothetical protein
MPSGAKYAIHNGLDCSQLLADVPLIELWHADRLSQTMKTKILMADNVIESIDELPETSPMKTTLTNSVVKGTRLWEIAVYSTPIGIPNTRCAEVFEKHRHTIRRAKCISPLRSMANRLQSYY